MDIKDLFAAVKTIEEEGVDGIDIATKLVGRDTALALLITHLRRQEGSMSSFPAPPGTDEKVMEILKTNNLL